MNSLVLDPTGHFLYILHSGGTIEEQSVNPQTGDLTFVANLTELAPAELKVAAIDPTARFLYATDVGGGKIFAYQIDQTDGALSAIPGSPFPLPAGNLPSIDAIDSTGKPRLLKETLATNKHARKTQATTPYRQ